MNAKLLVVLLVVALAVPAYATVWPAKMAVIGDSISRAALSDDSVDDDQPEHCWSTGDSTSDPVNSHWERIKANNPTVIGYNNAWNGAQSDDLLAQSNTTVGQGVQYVTIFMGGNDVCADDTAGMTPTATYEARFNEAIDVLQAGLPGADILVLELPKLRQVYDSGKSNFWCLLKWPIFGFCNNVLTNGSTQRNEAAARNIEYNNALRSLCAAQGVWFDDDIYELSFTYRDLSEVDCFHPNMDMQALIASASYDASRF
jgi:lysophospholipase L1-like esterase